MNPFITEPVHRNSRRKRGHDYCAPCIYLITATELAGRPALALFTAEGTFTRTQLGELINQEIDLIPKYHNEIQIYERMVMPDHIHIVLHVRQRLSRPLGSELAGFFAACSKHWQNLSGSQTVEKLFNTFHDSILRGRNQFEAMIRYVMENPMRLAIKRANPDLFKRYTHIIAGDREFAAFGNLFLLKHFDRQQVVVHRADSEQTRQEHRMKWIACAENGGVLVSPFISKDEQAIRDEALAAGGSIITIRKEGFEERFKPFGNEFELCAQGRLLLIAPWPDNIRRSKLTRSEALAMNDLAAYIAAYDGPLYRREKR